MSDDEKVTKFPVHRSAPVVAALATKDGSASALISGIRALADEVPELAILADRIEAEIQGDVPDQVRRTADHLVAAKGSLNAAIEAARMMERRSSMPDFAMRVLQELEGRR